MELQWCTSILSEMFWSLKYFFCIEVLMAQPECGLIHMSFHVFFEENICNLHSWHSAAVFSPTCIYVYVPWTHLGFLLTPEFIQAGKLRKLLQSEEALRCDCFSRESHSENFQVTKPYFSQWVCLDFLLFPLEGMLWVLMSWQSKQTLSGWGFW